MTEDHNHFAPRNPWGSPSRDPKSASAQTENAQATSERLEGWKGLLHKVWPSSAPSTQPTLRQADSFREVIETVVFVVVLVLLLKSFAAEAFVIPTGSMAVTLWGYQKNVTCPKCGHEYPVNCSQEADPPNAVPTPVVGATCENCRYHISDFRAETPPLDPSCNSGDRVLVAKFLYDGPLFAPQDIWREALTLLAIVVGALLGAVVSGLLVRSLLKSQNGRLTALLLPARVVGGGLVAGIVGFLLFESGPAFAMAKPERDDVVVFKYPAGPQKNYVPMNYIKRLIGLPGETIGICGGKLFSYVPPDGSPRFRDPEVPDKDLWLLDNLHLFSDQNPDRSDRHSRMPPDIQAEELFNKGQFQIIRKRPEVMLALKRLVYDNDHPAEDLKGPQFKRWVSADAGAWTDGGQNGFKHAADQGGAIAWLRYQHLLPDPANRQAPPQKQLIKDFMSYNSQELLRDGRDHLEGKLDWVSDLILECEVTVEEPTGQLRLELSKSERRYRARWDLASGACTLVRVDQAKPDAETELKTVATPLKGNGTYRLRFANVDDRLTVWVDGQLPFGDGVEYQPLPIRQLYPTARNDLEPASVGVTGAGVRVQKLKLWRDTYYSVAPGYTDLSQGWQLDLRQQLPLKTMYIPEHHYLCMGDNSKESSDSRAWGLVPERLMLGRALLIYYPFGRAGRIR